MPHEDNGQARESLQPEQVNFRVGTRTELDRQVLQILNNMPSETTKSDYVKEAMVIAYGTGWRVVPPEDDSSLRQRVNELENELRNLIRMIQNGSLNSLPQVESGKEISASASSGIDDDELERIEALVDQMGDAF